MKENLNPVNIGCLIAKAPLWCNLNGSDVSCERGAWDIIRFTRDSVRSQSFSYLFTISSRCYPTHVSVDKKDRKETKEWILSWNGADKRISEKEVNEELFLSALSLSLYNVDNLATIPGVCAHFLHPQRSGASL